MGAAVEHRVDDVVDGAEVGRLDLDHVSGAGAVERTDVVDRVGPLVGHELRRDRGRSCARSVRERADLRLPRAGVERVLDAQRERARRAAIARTSRSRGSVPSRP